MATEEITISELELADEVLADMTLPVDTATETRAVTLKQLRAWLGSSLPTGFIIPAVGKISDARFTLLDGKTLSRAGTYEAFCNKVVSEVQAGNWFACSEDEYAQDLSDFGQCGKFVVSNDYIRIPTITRFIGATITLSEIGKTYKERLPNIKGFMSNWANNVNYGANDSALFGTTDNKGRRRDSEYTATGCAGINFNASRSSSTYQDGAKVQPDHTKFPYYMVISTEGQTAEVEIDINKVYEDLELKGNKNLSNLTAEGKSLASGFGMPSNRYIDLTLGASGSSYTAPANGWVTLQTNAQSSSKFAFSSLGIPGSDLEWTSHATSSNWSARVCLPIKRGQSFYVVYGDTDPNHIKFRFIYAEGEK